jgi:uncharacterized protein (DUF58 family)
MSGETLIFLALLVSITLAGFNSGNNLLYLIAGIMLGGVLVSLIAGRINLSGLAVRRQVPAKVLFGHTFVVSLEVFNSKRFFGSFGIDVRGATEEQAHLFFLSIERKSKQAREARISLERRGLHEFPQMELNSKFPFGLFHLKRRLVDRQKIIVYPRIYDLGRKMEGYSHIYDEVPRHLKGPGSGLYGVREYRHGEDAVNISWKLSAKLDRLIVRETEREEKRRICVVFDNALGDGSSAAAEAFERAVSTTASLVWYLCRKGYSVKLVTCDKIIRYGEGLEHMHKMLATLALIQPVSEGAVIDGNLFEGGVGALVKCGDGAGSILPAHGDFALVIAEGIRPEGT